MVYTSGLPGQQKMAGYSPPTSMLTIANALTVLRILLVAPFVAFIHRGEYGTALAVFFAASVTDFADGYVARNFNQQSALGRILDPLADKILIAAAFVVMAISHATLPSIPVWLAVAVIGRDLFILLGSLVVYSMTHYKDFQPSWISKFNTCTELTFVVFFLGVHATDKLAAVRVLEPLCYGIVLATVIVSGLDYARKGLVILKAHRGPSSE
jgi:cardiolipin synthase